jgi:hypothetical protein
VSESQDAVVPKAFQENRSFLIHILSRLEGYRKHYEQGVIPALYAALQLIIESDYPAPEWVLKGAKTIVGDRLLNAPSTSAGGPAANELLKYQNDMRDFRRWLLVKKVMETDGCKQTPAFAKVSTLLQSYGEKVVAAGMVGTSYNRVEKARKDETKMWRYLIADYELAQLTQTVPGTEILKP